MRFASVVGAALMLSGCVMLDAERLAKALSHSESSACLSSHVVYGIGNGRVSVCRANADGTEVAVNQDGSMSLKRAMPNLDKHLVTADTLAQMVRLMEQMQAAVKALQPAPATPVRR